MEESLQTEPNPMSKWSSIDAQTLLQSWFVASLDLTTGHSMMDLQPPVILQNNF